MPEGRAEPTVPAPHVPRKSSRFSVYIRVKPLGAGGGGGEREREGQTHRLTYDSEGVCIKESRARASNPEHVEGEEGVSEGPPWRKGKAAKAAKGAKGGKALHTFTYARKVVPPSSDQADAYTLMGVPDMIDAVLDGYNVNIMANGQTGSGKTHSIFGPPTVDWTSPACAPDYGLLPRAAMAICQRLNEMQATTGDTYVLTGAMLETVWSQLGVKDLFAPEEEAFINAQHEVVGAVQVPLRTPSAILSFVSRVEDRATRATGMNDTSSRSHCVVQLRIWRHLKASGKVRHSTFNFLDLAGAERLSEAHQAYANALDRPPKERQALMEGMLNNYTLNILQQVVEQIHDNMRRGVKDVGSGVRFRQVSLTRILNGSLDPKNAAMTAMIVPVSQAPHNWKPTRDALVFGESMAKLRMKPKRQRTVPYGAFMKDIKRRHAESAAALRRIDCAPISRAGKGHDNKTYKYRKIRLAESKTLRQLVDMMEECL
ncbi:kinesin-like protein [Kipferlia bialata]|uniref:Kinesin-like protein n=1 Tax=Kipferlia bialata TaxID=797122 RepID=A0A9K3CRX1_9EUKA|nr:kinesin-like protein [Kipferlia bialata]|eukprot:g3034.t1